MDILDLQPNQLADLFNNGGNIPPKQTTPNFGANQDQNTDILNPPASTTETTTIPEDSSITESTTETTTLAEGAEPNADILDDSKKVVKPTKNKFEEVSTYFADRIKNKKFVPIEETLEDGTVRDFVPTSPEQIDEFIDTQINYQLDQKRKELEESWYNEKSPAWKAVAKYAEMVEDPTEILPFIQGIKTIESVSGLDENDPAGAEAIVRTRLEQRGDSKEIIDEQIEILKGSDKLVSTAQKYKPIILQQEQQALQKELQERRREEEEYRNLVTTIRDGAITAIEAPIFGKQKLSKEEKSAVYRLIAQPNPQSRGYEIFDKVDELFEKKNFEVLKEVALLLTNRDAFISYISTSAANKTAESVQRKIRAAGDSRSAGSGDAGDDKSRQVVQRNQYNITPRFGR